MLKNKKLIAGILLWVVLALLMVQDAIERISSDAFEFFTVFFFGLFFSYQIIAYLFGWLMPMLTFTGGLKKGEHDFIRAIMFVVFIGFWLWGFFSF